MVANGNKASVWQQMILKPYSYKCTQQEKQLVLDLASVVRRGFSVRISPFLCFSNLPSEHMMLEKGKTKHGNTCATPAIAIQGIISKSHDIDQKGKDIKNCLLKLVQKRIQIKHWPKIRANKWTKVLDIQKCNSCSEEMVLKVKRFLTLTFKVLQDVSANA